MVLHCDNTHLCYGNSPAFAVDAAELCALGSLVPLVPLRALDKKQRKTCAFMWLQIKISLSPRTPPPGTLASQYKSFIYPCLFGM